MWVGISLIGLVAFMAALLSAFALAGLGRSPDEPTVVKTAAAAPAPAAAPAKAPTLAESKGVAFEPYERVDPTLPAIPAGAVKKFRVDVLQHVTQVHPDLAPTEAWTYAVNGTAYRGTAASPPIVVDQGDKVEITFVNGGSKEMAVNMPHSIDFHSAEVAPNKNYIDIGAGEELKIEFVADHAGVFMYHCATQPVLLHTSAGMMGMMVVKPRDLAPVDRELWVTQEEFYLGAARQARRHGEDGRRDPGRDGVQRLRQPVQGAPDHRPRRREDPHVRARRRARASGARSTSSAPSSTRPSSRAPSAMTPRPSRSRRARAAGSSSRSTRRATTRS